MATSSRDAPRSLAASTFAAAKTHGRRRTLWPHLFNFLAGLYLNPCPAYLDYSRRSLRQINQYLVMLRCRCWPRETSQRTHMRSRNATASLRQINQYFLRRSARGRGGSHCRIEITFTSTSTSPLTASKRITAVGDGNPDRILRPRRRNLGIRYAKVDNRCGALVIFVPLGASGTCSHFTFQNRHQTASAQSAR